MPYMYHVCDVYLLCVSSCPDDHVCVPNVRMPPPIPALCLTQQQQQHVVFLTDGARNNRGSESCLPLNLGVSHIRGFCHSCHQRCLLLVPQQGLHEGWYVNAIHLFVCVVYLGFCRTITFKNFSNRRHKETDPLCRGD